MYTLSRILPDDSRRPIIAGMIARPEDPVGCEVVPGEQVEIGCTCEGQSELVAWVSLDTQGHVGLQALGDLVHFKLSVDGSIVAVAIFEDSDLLGMAAYSSAAELDDVRLFVRVFPSAGEETAAPSV